MNKLRQLEAIRGPTSTSAYPMIGGALTFFGLVTSRSIQKLLDRKWLSQLGDISYAIFANHLVWIGSFSSVLYLFFHVRLGPNGAAFASMTITFPVLIGVAFLVTRWVDNNFSRLANAVSRYSQKLLNSGLAWVRRQAKRLEANLPE